MFETRKPCWVLFILLAGWGLIHSGCQKAPTTTLTLSTWKGKAQLEILERQCAAYMREHPEVRVKITSFSSEEECMHSLGKVEADIIQVSSPTPPQWTQRQLLRDLLPQHPDFSSFIPEALLPCYHHGKLFMIPAGWSATVLYYNQTLFEQHGILPPRESWEWGDLLQAATLLTSKNPETHEITRQGLELSPSPSSWIPFIWQNHGQLLLEDGSWALLDPQFVQSNLVALEFYSALVREHQVATIPVLSKKYQPSAAFIRGEAAMTLGPRSLCHDLREQARFQWNVTLLPRGVQNASWVEVDGYGISSASKQAGEAWKLILHLVQFSSQAEYAMEGWNVPSSKELVKSKIFVDFPGTQPIHNDIWLKTLALQPPRFQTPLWSQGRNILQEEMLLLMQNPEREPREALERMQTRLEEFQLIEKVKPVKKTK